MTRQDWTWVRVMVALPAPSPLKEALLEQRLHLELGSVFQRLEYTHRALDKAQALLTELRKGGSP